MQTMNRRQSGVARRQLKDRSRPLKANESVRHTGYDETSGHMYDEVEIIASKRQSHSWIVEYRAPKIIKLSTQGHKGVSGARSLFDVALSRCALQTADFTSVLLKNVPWMLGAKIWNELTERHLESFYVWREFAKAYNTQFIGHDYRYMIDIKAPALPIVDYLHGLSCSKDEWALALRISPREVAAADLVAIAKVPNLTILDLSDGQLWIEHRNSHFDHRIMRTWTELIAYSRAFSRLEVLMLGWQENVSAWIFRYLRLFPRLRLIIMTDCPSVDHKNHKDWDDEAAGCGWHHLPSKRGPKTLRPLLNDSAFAPGTVSNLYTQDPVLSPEHCETSKSRRRRPLVECWLGKPKPWTHIIDEFPGTRTVWFERQDASKQLFPGEDSQGLQQQAHPQLSQPAPHRRALAHKRQKGNTVSSLLASFIPTL